MAITKGDIMKSVEDMTIKEARDFLDQAEMVRGLLGRGSAAGSSSGGGVAEGRFVVVVDRGWIFAGDQSLTEDGHIRLSDAVHVFGWRDIGFPKLLKEWDSDKTDLRKCADVEIPQGSVIFRVPVPRGWGLK